MKDHEFYYNIQNGAMLAIIHSIILEIMKENNESIFGQISEERLSSIIVSDLNQGLSE